MPNVIAVVQDDRLRRQIEQFLTELGMDDLRFATFRSNQEFQSLYFRDRSKDPVSENTAADDGAEMKLFSEIHAVVFAMDTLGEKSGPWIDKLKFQLKHFKYWPESTPTRLLLMKYEDDGISKLDVLHPALDDLIYLPIDRLVFLQKMQIFLTIPKKVTPAFLFNQEVQHEIEISKIAKVDRMSDVALAIRNPVPLRKGLPGHFYLTLPGEKSKMEVRGKVMRSEPHPDYPGQFLVYFSYFGMSKLALSQVRRALSKAPQYKSLISDNPQEFRYNPDGLFNDDLDSQIFGVIVIDPDDIAGNNLSQGLKKEMDRLDLVTESSYQLFLHKYLEPKSGENDEAPPSPVDASEFYRAPFSLSISAGNLQCLSVDPGPIPGDKFLGHPADTLFSSPDGWLGLIAEKESRLIMEEAALLASKGRVLQKLMTLKDDKGNRRAVNFKIYRGASEGVVTIEMSPSTANEVLLRLSEQMKQLSLHFVIIDANFIPEEASSWLEGLRMRAVQVGLAENQEQLKILITTDQELKPNLGWLNNKDIMGLFVKPVDMRQMLFLLSEFLPNKDTMYRFDNLGWSQPSIPLHVAKNVHLEAISEYGATIKSAQKLVPGTMIYLRKSIFDNAPNNCLAARVYSCEEHPKDKGYFQVNTTYFGINDAFLKFARTWIRENYANQKKGEN